MLTILPPSSERNPIGIGLGAPPQTAAIRQRHAELRQLREEREHLVEQVRRLQGLGQGPHGPGEVTIPGGDNSPGGGGGTFASLCLPACFFFLKARTDSLGLRPSSQNPQVDCRPPHTSDTPC